MSTTTTPVIAPVQKSITVKADAARAFRVFTDEIDSWWPASHHIGASPMLRNVLEGREGGRCYSQHDGGVECQWGSITTWDPPRRFVMAWQVTPDWKQELNPARASEIEVRFTPEGDGYTRVDLEHRHFERHGEGSQKMRDGVGSDGGWNGLLELFRGRVESGS